MEKMKFFGFEPDSQITRKAQLALTYIQERAPSDAKTFSFLRKDDDSYTCTIEVMSASCPFTVTVTHKLASAALDKAELAALRRLARWRGNRYLLADNFPRREPLRMAR